MLSTNSLSSTSLPPSRCAALRTGAAALAALLVLGSACSDDAPAPGLLEQRSGNLAATQAAQLAHPEYDLNVTAGYWWMHSANSATIDSKIAEGYRLLSVDILTVSPLLFTATFVGNTGDYLRNGGGWNPQLTEAQLLAIKADPARRIVSVAPYRLSGDRRYAAVWTGNTGTQQRN
ncbi:MAG: hypothetical protein H7X95_13585, partial [Deltaproteobacteria bacterium]|nr:hypothetical protein [Deltaproteobacteria bacterium]